MAYYGIYRGIVVNTVDPGQKSRLQVSVPAVNAIAWAQPCLPYTPSGKPATPPVGTQVYVMFEAGDKNAPVWLGCAPS
jgi:hypothetical protein